MAEFTKGLFVKKPHGSAPSFIKHKVSIKRDEFINWLQTIDTEWVNLDIKESKEGKMYAQVDDWKPNNGLSNEQTQDIQTLRDNHNAGKVEESDSIDPSEIPF